MVIIKFIILLTRKTIWDFRLGGAKEMNFEMPKYISPDFSDVRFKESPNVKYEVVEKDGVAPNYYHAMSIYQD